MGELFKHEPYSYLLKDFLLIEREKYVVLMNVTLQFGISNDGLVWGVCYKDKYCYTNIFGFEILK